MTSPAGSSRSREATTTPRASRMRSTEPRTPIAFPDEIDWNLFELVLDREDKAHQRRKSQGTPGVGLSTHTTPRARQATTTPRGSAGKASRADSTPRARAPPLVANSDDEEGDPDDSLLSVNSSQFEGLSSDSLPSATGSQFDTSPPTTRRVVPSLSSVDEDSLPNPYGSQFEQSRPTRQIYSRAYWPAPGDIREESQISHESFDESMESDGLPDLNDSQLEQSRPVRPYHHTAEVIPEEESDERSDSDSDSLPDPNDSQFQRTQVSQYRKPSRGDSAEMSDAEHLLGDEKGESPYPREGQPTTFPSQKRSQGNPVFEHPSGIDPPVSADVRLDAEALPSGQVPISSHVPPAAAVSISREVPITSEEPDAPEVSVLAEVPITAVAASSITHVVIGRTEVVVQEGVQQGHASSPRTAEQPTIPEAPTSSIAHAPVAAAHTPRSTAPSSSVAPLPPGAAAPIPAIAQVFPSKARRAPDDPNEFAPPDAADMTDAERRGEVPAVAKPVSPLRGPRKPRKETRQKTTPKNPAVQAREEVEPVIVEPEGPVDDEPLFEVDAMRAEEAPPIDPELMLELVEGDDNVHKHDPPALDGIVPKREQAPQDEFDRQVAVLQDPESAPIQFPKSQGREPSPPPVDPYMVDEDGRPFESDFSMEGLIPQDYVAPKSNFHGQLEGQVSRYSRLVGGRTRRWTPTESLLLWRTVQRVPMGIDNPITMVSYLHGEFGIESHTLALYNNQHMRNRMRQICETRANRGLPIEGRARMFLPPRDPRRQAYLEDKETFRQAELESMEREIAEEKEAMREKEARQEQRRKRKKVAKEDEYDEARSEEGRDYPEIGYAVSDEEVYVAPAKKRRQIEAGPSIKRRQIEAGPSKPRLQTYGRPNRKPHIVAPPARKRQRNSDDEEDELDSSPSPELAQRRPVQRSPSPYRAPKRGPAPRVSTSHLRPSSSASESSIEDDKEPRYYRRRLQDFDHVPVFNIDDLDEPSSEAEPSQSPSPRQTVGGVGVDDQSDEPEDELEDYESEEGEREDYESEEGERDFNDDVVMQYDDAPLGGEGGEDGEDGNASAGEGDHPDAANDEQPADGDPGSRPSPRESPAAPDARRSSRRATILAIEPPTLSESQRRRYAGSTISPVATRHVPVTRQHKHFSRVDRPRERERQAASAALSDDVDGSVEETMGETLESVEDKGSGVESYQPSDVEPEAGPSQRSARRSRTRARSAADDVSYDDEESEGVAKPTVWSGRTRTSGAHELEAPRTTRSGLRRETRARADRGKQPAQPRRRHTRAAARAASAALEVDAAENGAEALVEIEEGASAAREEAREEAPEAEEQDEEMDELEDDELNEEIVDEMIDGLDEDEDGAQDDEIDDATAESDARAVRRAMITRTVLGSSQ